MNINILHTVFLEALYWMNTFDFSNKILFSYVP